MINWNSSVNSLAYQLDLCAHKKHNLERFKNDIQTITIGSSHGYYGFDSNIASAAFNLCTPSQDLKYSFLLYEKLIKGGFKIKNVVVFYSVFSSGSEVEKSPSENVVGVALNKIFSLSVNYDNPVLVALEEIANGYCTVSCSTSVNKGYPPQALEIIPEEYGVEKRARKHLHLHKKNGAIGYLYQIIALSKVMNHFLYIVLPPYRSDYTSLLIENESPLFSELDLAISKVSSYTRPIVLNFLGNNNFTDNDFLDFDHLDPRTEGPKKLTEIIQHNINLFSN